MRSTHKNKQCHVHEEKAAQRGTAGQTVSDCPTGSIVQVVSTAIKDFSALVELRDNEHDTHPNTNVTSPESTSSVAAIAVPTSLPTLFPLPRRAHGHWSAPKYNACLQATGGESLKQLNECLTRMTPKRLTKAAHKKRGATHKSTRP